MEFGVSLKLNSSTIETVLTFATIKKHSKGRAGGGLVVNVLAFYSNDPSLNPLQPSVFSVKSCLKRTKINKKRPASVHFKKTLWNISALLTSNYT